MERVEREVGGGIGMGNTCKPMAVSFQCMTKIHHKLKKKKKTSVIPGSNAILIFHRLKDIFCIITKCSKSYHSISYVLYSIKSE